MAITFQRAPTVEIGGKITSADHNKLAKAFNDRLLSGLGDPTWRMWWKAYATFGRFRVAVGDDQPAVDEWFATFMLVEPAEGAPDPPLNECAQPMVTFPLGVPGGCGTAIDDEKTRLNLVPVRIPVDLADTWELAKEQRGLLAPTGPHNAPAVEASQAHKALYSYDAVTAAEIFLLGNDSYPFNKTYGGFRGIPDQEDCGGDVFHSIRKFTPLAGGSILTYHTCGSAGGTLASLEYGPDDYILHFHSGSSVRLSYRDYIEGPYENDSYLQKHNVDAFSEAICRYVSSFRGADSQRTSDGDFRITQIAFDFQHFFTSQYRLAPALGDLSDDELTINPVYPTLQTSGDSWLYGDLIPFTFPPDGPTTYAFPAGYCLGGAYITRTDSTLPIRLCFRDTSSGPTAGQIRTVVIDAGESEKIVYWDDPLQAPLLCVTPMSDGGDTEFLGIVSIECAALVCYQPDLTDAYVVLRRGTTDGVADPCDVQGKSFTSAKARSDSYFDNGCIVHDEDLAAITDPNASPVYEAMRREMKAHFRLLKRHLFVDYAIEDGVGVLWFQRNDIVSGVTIDLFEGIAPPEGEDEGIKAEAPAHKFSNEWVMFIESCGYGGVGFELDDYADPLAFMHNRCGAFSAHVAAIPELHDQMTYTSFAPPVVEAPSGMNYIAGLNATATADFFSSCPVYKNDYKVASVTITEDGLVRVQLDRPLDAGGSFRNDENVVTDYANSTGLLGVHDGTLLIGSDDLSVTVPCPQRTGDLAMDAADSPTHGACVPRFHFTKLMEKVHVDSPDDNETLEETDTRTFADRLQWMHWALEAICDGYIDPGAASNAPCARAPQLTLNLLCYRAGIQSQWLRLMPARIRANAKGFGPVPNTKLYAEYFNHLAACINALTILPLELPRTLQYRVRTTVGEMVADNVIDHDRLGAFDDSAGEVMAAVGTPGGSYDPEASDPYTYSGVSDSGWGSWITPISGIASAVRSASIAVNQASILGSCVSYYAPRFPGVAASSPPPPDWLIRGLEQKVQLRLTDISTNALRSEIRDLVDDSGELVARVRRRVSWETIGTTYRPSCPNPPSSTVFWHDASVKLDAFAIDETTCGLFPVPAAFFDGDAVDLPPLVAPPSIHWYHLDPGHQCIPGCGEGVSTDLSIQAVGYLRFAVPLAS